MLTSLFTCSGASVGVSISTQRRMPPRMALESKGLAVVSMWLFICSGGDQWTGVNVTLDSDSTGLDQGLAYFFVGAWSFRKTRSHFPLSCPSAFSRHAESRLGEVSASQVL